ncbi:HAD family hydrolase [Pseudomonas alliivorans]|uniref:HAD family hydrolase n=1 Tax=Pseudomonas alliivorans TaxID=2810613 RepID=UPI001AE41C9F|nr:HAD family hydrolase [Pseudomonas alliivorans]MBP0940829.1 HAD family hydrolase [Pseudomonas alliivorans]MEE4878776.1 HAD family hydrolase [Pseudomonas alliivorans]MEE4929991.1 HAD family hydrolase [Pseudomonas alliivorans]MEE4935686.1 HAD family hydrolase [Pseudomonas alliivorans]MEE4940521.1 HAD family hydrolase [Pseudomonas alliivorans]
MINDLLHFTGVEHVVFDWNGTLIDDIDLAVFAVNRCGEHYGVAPITAEQYRARFDFPIAGFYAALGFDLDSVPFPIIVQRYLEHFDAHVAECPLQPYVIEFLDAARRAGIGVSILSASHCDVLVQTLKAKGLYDRFEHVVGLNHNQATSKTAEALMLQKTLGTPASRTLFVGDTLHDFDVACSVGWSPVLVSTGHQDSERLRLSGAPLFRNLGELLERFVPARTLQTETGSA